MAVENSLSSLEHSIWTNTHSNFSFFKKIVYHVVSKTVQIQISHKLGANSNWNHKRLMHNAVMCTLSLYDIIGIMCHLHFKSKSFYNIAQPLHKEAVHGCSFLYIIAKKSVIMSEVFLVDVSIVSDTRRLVSDIRRPVFGTRRPVTDISRTVPKIKRPVSSTLERDLYLIQGYQYHWCQTQSKWN